MQPTKRRRFTLFRDDDFHSTTFPSGDVDSDIVQPVTLQHETYRGVSDAEISDLDGIQKGRQDWLEEGEP